MKEGSGHEWAVQLDGGERGGGPPRGRLLATVHLAPETPQEGVSARPSSSSSWERRPLPANRSSTRSRSAAPGQGRRSASRPPAPTRAGEAHALFRLGYDPQASILAASNWKTSASRCRSESLPTTQYADRKRERDAGRRGQGGAAERRPAPGRRRATCRIEPSTTGEVIRPISPYVYGVNASRARAPAPPCGAWAATGGTAYNWELNASSAGGDYNH